MAAFSEYSDDGPSGTEVQHAQAVAEGAALAEQAAASGDPKEMAKVVDSMPPAARAETLAKLTREARTAADAEIKARTARLTAKADALHEAGGDRIGTDETAIVAAMKGLTPAEAAEFETIYGDRFENQDTNEKPSLRANMRDELSEDSPELALVMSTLDGREDACYRAGLMMATKAA